MNADHASLPGRLVRLNLARLDFAERSAIDAAGIGSGP